ncbi:MAG: hypothetical protein AAFY98_00760 [Verrucomicrobiota bacterium]
MSTYSALRLYREVKSIRRRSAGEENKIFLWIGGHSSDRPFRKVLRSSYIDCWNEEVPLLNADPVVRSLPKGEAADLTRKLLENRIYDRLAAHADELNRLEKTFESTHGRPMSPQEASLYAGSVLKKQPIDQQPAPDQRARNARRQWLHQILGKVQDRNRNQADRLQAQWIEIVGVEDSMQTELSRLDRLRGIAYVRSLSPGVSQKLKRNPVICEKLSATFGCKIKQLVFR